MTTSVSETAKAVRIAISEDTIVADLTDGRTISVPIGWYPRLAHATLKERKNFRFIGDREGIHWPDVDEDISVGNLLLGRASGESNVSFGRWLAARKQSRKPRPAKRRS